MTKRKVTIEQLAVRDKPSEDRLTLSGGTPSVNASAATPVSPPAREQLGDESETEVLEDDPVEPSDADDDSGPERFSMLGYSGAPVSRWYGTLVIDLAGMNHKHLPMAALKSHDADRVAGVIESFDITDEGLMEEGRFVDTESGREVLHELEQKIPYKASIGVNCVKAAYLGEDLTLDINGRTIEGPAEVWVASEVYETSFTVTPADSNTSVDILSTQTNTTEASMPKDNSGGAPTRDVDKSTLENDSGSDVVSSAPVLEPQGLSADDVLAQAAQGARLGLSIEDVQELAQTHRTPEALGNAMLAKAAEMAPVIVTGQTLSMGDSESERFNNAVADGLLMGHGYRFGNDKPAEGATDFRRMGLQQILRECLHATGDPRALRYAPTELAAVVMGMKGTLQGFNSEMLGYGAGSSTGDFAFIIGSVLHRRMMQSYEESPATWKPLATTATAKDFREMHGISLSEAPDLLPVAENGEYKEAFFRDRQESYRVSKHGRVVSLTFEMIVNDDTRQLLRIPQLLGTASARLESDMFWKAFLSNPVMQEDNKELFHADHGNLLTGAEISSSSLDQAYQAMMMQRGFNPEAGQYPSKRNAQAGALLNVIPKYLAVPPALKSKAEVLIRSMADPDGKHSNVKNIYQDDLDIIVEPRLQIPEYGGSSKNWFLSADPAQVDTMEVSWLEGHETPLTTSFEPFERDGVSWKQRHIFGVGIMDFRGRSKNPGP